MNLKYTISTKQDANFVLSSSEDKFSNITNNSLIKFDNSNILYSPIKKESFFYVKNFSVETPKILTINENIEYNLQSGDTIKISFKEYEAKFIANIIDGGRGYLMNNSLYVLGGIPTIDVSNGQPNTSKLEVIETNEEGKILQINIVNNGKYILPPDNPISCYAPNGQDLKLDIRYLELSSRQFLSRNINEIYFSNGKTFIILDYSIPEQIKEGKLSVEKQKLTISPNYNENKTRNVSYEVYNHFSPNLKLPLLVKGSFAQETILNQSLLKLDEEINNIKKKLGI